MIFFDDTKSLERGSFAWIIGMAPRVILKGTVMGTPNREPQEYGRNIIKHKDPGVYVPIIFLLCS